MRVDPFLNAEDLLAKQKREATRVRAHIKALCVELKTAPGPADNPTGQVFISGMLTGLASSVRILDGARAEDALEEVAERLAATIGRAYLDGTLPADPAASAPSPAEETLGRVQALAAEWTHSGGPALGTSITRWWDTRLAELNTALAGPKER